MRPPNSYVIVPIEKGTTTLGPFVTEGEAQAFADAQLDEHWRIMGVSRPNVPTDLRGRCDYCRTAFGGDDIRVTFEEPDIPTRVTHLVCAIDYANVVERRYPPENGR